MHREVSLNPKEALEAILSTTLILLAYLDRDFNFIAVNQAYADAGRRHRDDFIGKNHFDLYPDAENEAIFERVVESGEVQTFSAKPFEHPDQPERGTTWWSWQLLPRKDESGIVTSLVLSLLDITERKQAEQSLQEAEAELRHTIEIVPGIIAKANAHTGYFTHCNPALSSILGFSAEEFLARPFIEFIHPDDRQATIDEVEKQLQGSPVARFENRYVCKDGSYKWLEWMATEADEQGLVYAAATDITERKQAEKALAHSHDLMRYIIEHSRGCVAVHDRDLNYIYVSQSYLDDYGVKEVDVIGKHHYDVFPDLPQKWRDVHQKALAGEISSAEEDSYVREDGTTDWTRWECRPWYEADGGIGGIVVYTEIITERKKAEQDRISLEAQLRQSQKLESIGTLAGGVAHEVNNPLTGMINYAELVKDHVQEDEKALEYTQGIIDEGNRIAKIVKNLLAFSRQDNEAQSLTRIPDIVDASMSLLHASLLKDKIEVVLDIPDDLPMVRCRSQQIQQVLVNLLVNSRAALNERYPEYDQNKLIRITSRWFGRDGEDWIRTTIEDHGIGVSEDATQRIFDPFFSTKPRHKGTGLGLSVSFGIVRDHNGELTMESKLREYTRFHVDLRVNNE